MHCRACDKVLSDWESTVKNAHNGQYMDLCKVCLEDVRPFTNLIERKDLITVDDLEVEEDHYFEPEDNIYSDLAQFLHFKDNFNES